MKIKSLIIVLLIVGIASFIIYKTGIAYKKDTTPKRFELTTGFVKQYTRNGKGVGGSVRYEYTVDGKLYKAVRNMGSVRRDSGVKFEHRYFPVAYNLNDKAHSKILIHPIDFDKYSLPFPDSLNWVVSSFNVQ